VRTWNVKFNKIGSIFKNPEIGQYEIGPLPNGLGGPYSTATEYYRAWAAANNSKPGATSDFPSRIETIASIISENDSGPFRLIHPDFGHNNIIVDDDFNILSVIDWEYSFVGPPELAARFPLRVQMYPEAILPEERDANGRIIDEHWREMSEKRERWVNEVALQESPSCDAPRLSSSMFGVQADILFMIRMWEERMPWMYIYQAGVKEGLDVMQQRLRQANERT
jgi:Phosphotransferase enzyme family